MAICPHCKTESINPLRKWWAGSANPVACPRCGGLSHVRTFADIKVNAASSLVLAVGLLVGFWMQLLFPATIGFALACGTYVFGWSRLHLVPTTAATFAATRWWRWGFVLVAYGCIALSLFLFRR